MKLGHVALDGTKMKANASKHKAMSYERMKKREAELAAEVDRWLQAAEAADAEEDELYGDQRGDELPDGWPPKRSGWRRSARRRRSWRPKPRPQRRGEAPRRRKRSPSGGPQDERRTAAPTHGSRARRQGAAQLHRSREPNPEDQGRFIQGYNAQAAVDARGQMIVAHDLVASTSDQDQLVPLLDAIKANLGRQPKEASADAGTAAKPTSRLLRGRASVAMSRPAVRSTRARATANRPGRLTRRCARTQAGADGAAVTGCESRSSSRFRSDQGGERLPTVPAARPRQSEGRMGDDLHRPQPDQTRWSPHERCYRFSHHSSLGPIWTGS